MRRAVICTYCDEPKLFGKTSVKRQPPSGAKDLNIWDEKDALICSGCGQTDLHVSETYAKHCGCKRLAANASYYESFPTLPVLSRIGPTYSKSFGGDSYEMNDISCDACSKPGTCNTCGQPILRGEMWHGGGTQCEHSACKIKRAKDAEEAVEQAQQERNRIWRVSESRKRKALRLCLVCGKLLGPLDILGGNLKHRQCEGKYDRNDVSRWMGKPTI